MIGKKIDNHRFQPVRMEQTSIGTFKTAKDYIEKNVAQKFVPYEGFWDMKTEFSTIFQVTL